jgi:hypothetical protein
MYLERAFSALREHGIVFPDALLTHVSPIGWEHINLTGDYTGTPTAALLKVDLDPYARMKCTGAQSTRCGNRSQKNGD